MEQSSREVYYVIVNDNKKKFCPLKLSADDEQLPLFQQIVQTNKELQLNVLKSFGDSCDYIDVLKKEGYRETVLKNAEQVLKFFGI